MTSGVSALFSASVSIAPPAVGMRITANPSSQSLFAQRSTDGCSLSVMSTAPRVPPLPLFLFFAYTEPKIAKLFASVPDPVKITLPSAYPAPNPSATSRRAFARAFAVSLPMEYTDEGFAHSEVMPSAAASIARADGAVVAALSRYTFLI